MSALLSFGQSLIKGCLFGLDSTEAGIQLCQPAQSGRPFGRAPCLLDFQAGDLHMRAVGNADAIHTTGERANGPETS